MLMLLFIKSIFFCREPALICFSRAMAALTSLPVSKYTSFVIENSLEEMDKHMGRLFDYIRNNPELRENTLIIFTSDNGPDKAVNTAGPLRGYKTNLYEGGFREPFIAWWPAVIPEKLQ